MRDFEFNPDLQIGTVFETNGTSIKISLRRNLNELTQSHEGTVYSIGQIGSLIKLYLGRTILFAMVRMLRLQTDEEIAAVESRDAWDRRVLEADLFGEARWIASTTRLSFDRGVRTYPLPLQPVFLVTSSESRELYSAIERSRPDGTNKFISFASYVGVDGVGCHADMDKLFGQHCAVLGSTGSGKSTAVAAVIHAVLDHRPEPERACSPRIVIIDPHGEYGSAFGNKAIVFRAYEDASDTKQSFKPVKLPYWLMSNDEFRQLIVGKTKFEATSQANTVSKALAHARMYAAGLVKSAVDSFTAASSDNPPDVPKPIDNKYEPAIGNFNRDRPLPFSLDEFEAHIRKCQAKKLKGSDWIDVSPSEFNEEYASILDKLRVLRNDSRIAFLMKSYAAGDPGLEDIIAQFLGSFADNAASVRILDISGLPNEVAGPLTAALARLLFSYKLHQTRDEREKDPILLVCEEAHRYVPDRGEAQYAAAQDAIRRIAREGRKYGIGLMLVSQRPADVESTVLSQCNSWLVLRLTNGADQEHVGRFLPDTLAGLIKLLPSLARREALFVGEAAALPARVRLNNVPEDMRPRSADISFAEGWGNVAAALPEIKKVADRMAG
ncbi:ATP-binding protein [Methylocystis sp. FS]|uniref:ATP-binding protein n=1 Tax=Methylocystis silviterrae TaxID=2743612 RepID=UPI0015843892|nr:ATP-binding protein [Methylocystis silviterrae]NUJ80208.1 ATP-binding protein [Methylocystis silviterrae]